MYPNKEINREQNQRYGERMNFLLKEKDWSRESLDDSKGEHPRGKEKKIFFFFFGGTGV
jgi:hypothetical protein